MIVIYSVANTVVKNKIFDILKVLGIEENTKDNYLVKFRPLFQEYFSVIFKFNDSTYELVIKEMRDKIERYGEYKDMIINDILSKGFRMFVRNMFKLCIYMQLHDPQLSFSIDIERKPSYYYYNKNDHIVIDGFSKDITPCIVIMPTPMIRNNYVYYGLKPGVIILSEYSVEIIEECDRNKIVKPRSYSSADLLNIPALTETAEEVISKLK
jgi:hypothetical protein